MSEALKRSILEKCHEMEIPMVGVANVERWEEPPLQPWMPEEFYPQSIYPKAKSGSSDWTSNLPSSARDLAFDLLPRALQDSECLTGSIYIQAGQLPERERPCLLIVPGMGTQTSMHFSETRLLSSLIDMQHSSLASEHSA